jgi:hypothetical protein
VESGFWQANSAVAMSLYEAEAKSSGLGGFKVMSEHHQHEHKIELKIVTTAGNFPESGFKEFSWHEKLETVLKEAAEHLKLHNTENWIARLGDRQLNPALSLEANQIPDKSKISWAPSEPGGGKLCIRN